MPNSKGISIVVTTYNRRHRLPTLLEAFIQQSDLDFQLILVSDGSTDGTDEFAKSLRLPFDFKFIDTKFRGYGLAIARNLGILNADKSYVAVLDDDSIPHFDYIKNLKDIVSSDYIVAGPRYPANGVKDSRLQEKMERFKQLKPGFKYKINELLEMHIPLIENNICMSKKNWIENGLFSERIKLYGIIGQEFFARMRYRGISYVFYWDIVIFHHSDWCNDGSIKSRKKKIHAYFARRLRKFLKKKKFFDKQIEWAKTTANELDLK